VALAAALGSGPSLERHTSVLLALNVSVAIFAVNFGILEFQLSPYRQYSRLTTARYRVAALILVVVSLVPLVSLVARSSWTGTVAISMLPVAVFGAAILGFLAAHETQGTSILAERGSRGVMRRFLPALAESMAAALEEQEQQRLVPVVNLPTHEWTGLPTPTPLLEGDPVELVVGMADTALRVSDLATFDAAVQKLLSYWHELDAYSPQDSGAVKAYEIARALTKYLAAGQERMLRNVLKADASGAFANRLQGRLAEVVRNRAQREAQTSNAALTALYHMQVVSEHLLQQRIHRGPIQAVVIARQAAQKGLDRAGDAAEALLFRHSLASYADTIKALGQEAVRQKNSDFLYRCLDALGWLGCAAVQKEHRPVTIACLEGLAQLGRESKAAGLKCFWHKCALNPEDHAWERLDWIASWVAASTGIPADSDKDAFALRPLEEAYSRLRGKACRLSIRRDREGGPHVVIEKTNEPHRITFQRNGFSRTIDYSDPNELQEHVIY
jgi:hypothetical protein